MCGGDALAGQKKEEANSQIGLNNALQAGYTQRNNAQTPFLMDRLKSGLPFFHDLTDYSNGTLAKSFAPVRAGVNRNLAGFGDTLPSGFKQQQLAGVDEAQGQAFDQNMVNNLMANENEKMQAANELNPLGYATGASGTASSVLSAPPVQSGGIGNFLGGAVSGLMNSAASAGTFI